MTTGTNSEKIDSLTADTDDVGMDVSRTVEKEDTPAFSDRSLRAIVPICIPIALICLLVWLDEGILATAIPRISDEFNSFDQIGWYGPSYLFGLCACQLPFGRAYKDFPSKIVYLFSLFIFEVASIVQAAAPSSEAFIVGRVLAGIGGSGVLAGSLTIFSEEIPKAKLPYVMGVFSWVHSIGGIAGPVIGGAITSSFLTWRWYGGRMLSLSEFIADLLKVLLLESDHICRGTGTSSLSLEGQVRAGIQGRQASSQRSLSKFRLSWYDCICCSHRGSAPRASVWKYKLFLVRWKNHSFAHSSWRVITDLRCN